MPDNGRFLLAACIVAGIIYLGYTLSLFARARRR